MGKYAHAERERIALETFIETYAPDEATEDVWRLLARRIVDVVKAEIREEIVDALYRPLHECGERPLSAVALDDEMIAGMEAYNDRIEAEAIGNPPGRGTSSRDVPQFCRHCGEEIPPRHYCECVGSRAEALGEYNRSVTELMRDVFGVEQVPPDPEDLEEPGDPGFCTRCGAPFESVRPGKSQPACACWRRYV